MRSLIISFLSHLFIVAVGPACAGNLCLLPSSNGLSVTRDCQPSPKAHEHAIIGYSEFTAPCVFGESCTHCGTGGPYEWCLSASATSPSEHVGDLPDVASLYLWNTCTVLDGFTSAEFALVGIDLTVLAYHPLLGVNNGTATELQLDMAGEGCLYAPLLVGEIVVTSNPTAVPETIVERSWGRIRSLYR